MLNPLRINWPSFKVVVISWVVLPGRIVGVSVGDTKGNKALAIGIGVCHGVAGVLGALPTEQEVPAIITNMISAIQSEFLFCFTESSIARLSTLIPDLQVTVRTFSFLQRLSTNAARCRQIDANFSSSLSVKIREICGRILKFGVNHAVMVLPQYTLKSSQ